MPRSRRSGDDQFDIFKHLDMGDFIGVNGEMFTTKSGEISVKLASFVILAKALRPPAGENGTVSWIPKSATASVISI